MPGSTANLGIRYPLGPEPPTVAPDMQRLAGDVDAAIITPTVFASVRRDTSSSAAGTGSIWFTDLIANTSVGNINPGSGGISIPLAGWYEIEAWARLSLNSGTNVQTAVQIGVGGNMIAIGYVMIAATGQNVTARAKIVTSLAAATVLQLGFTQAVASQVQVTGGNNMNGLTARLIKRT